ncbi:molybdenum cofactor synthesis domain-containing protein [Clostridium pascui]|uniref:molybdenum cofactor synthesis domain-containing protein n=1 Tax=Clostridium pascui TaxID=46609 RepID=UPI001957B99F
MMRAAIITVSDKGSRGEREDITGKVLKEILIKEEYDLCYYSIVPDEIDQISNEIVNCCYEMDIDLLLTNGGTGFAKRDVTPEATLKVIDKQVPGIPEAMRMDSFKITPKAILTRGVAGIRGNTLIINLPGSPKGASENLQVVLPALKHGIEVLKGEASECAR